MGPKKKSSNSMEMSNGVAKKHELQLQMEEVEMAQIQEGKVGVSIIYYIFFLLLNIFVVRRPISL